MKKVLIICTANSCRSQMAEGLVNIYLLDNWLAYSAGIKASKVNRRAIEVMREIGIDISNQRSKSIDEFDNPSMLDLVITVCDDAAEKCPIYHAGIPQTHIRFDDPAIYKDRSDEDALPYFRAIRDDIRERLISYLRQR